LTLPKRPNWFPRNSFAAQGFNGTHAGGSKSRENAGGQGNKAENESHGCQGDRIALTDAEKERSKKSGQTQRAGDPEQQTENHKAHAVTQDK
jgi:hypothetical protein